MPRASRRRDAPCCLHAAIFSFQRGSSWDNNVGLCTCGSMIWTCGRLRGCHMLFEGRSSVCLFVCLTTVTPPPKATEVKLETSPKQLPNKQPRIRREWHLSGPTRPLNLFILLPMERYLLTWTYTCTSSPRMVAIFRKDNRIRSICRRGIGIWLTLLSCHSMHSVTTCAQWRGASSSWKILLPEETQCIMG